MLNYSNIQNAMNVNIAVSDKMAQKILLWNNMYQNKAPWLTDDIKSLELPATISSEMARLVTIERNIQINGGNSRSDFLKSQFDLFDDLLPVITEYGCSSSGLILKPYVDQDKIMVDFVQAGDFYPVSFSGRMVTEAIMPEFKRKGDKLYIRLEHHKFSNQEYTIINKAFCSNNARITSNNIVNLGGEIPLSSVPEWSSLEPEVTLKNIDRPLFSYFKVPLANNIDPYSPLGVSVYARAVNQIKDADEQYGAALWEYRSKETAIHAGEEFFEKDRKTGDVRIPKGMSRVFKNLGDEAADKSGAPFFNVFSPDIRDESFYNGFNRILQRVEFNSGLAYGTLSDPQNVDKTAEEIKTSKQRSYATVKAIQRSLEDAIENLIYSMDAWATLYDLAPEGHYENSYRWDDSIIVDAEKEREEYRKDVAIGAMNLYEYRMKRYGEDEDTAKSRVPESAGLIP